MPIVFRCNVCKCERELTYLDAIKFCAFFLREHMLVKTDDLRLLAKPPMYCDEKCAEKEPKEERKYLVNLQLDR